MASERRIVVLISGSGSNLQALLDAVSDGRLGQARITQVISNRKAAFGLERARKAGVPTAVLSMKTWLGRNAGKTREDYDEVLAGAVLAGASGRSQEWLDAQGAQGQQLVQQDTAAPTKPDLVVLAGFMHIVSPRFLQVVGNTPCINLHPALPGAFDGIEAIKRAHDAFQEGKLKDGKTGVMVHEVVAEVDRGRPIVVQEVECIEGQSLEDLEGRIHEVEHRIIVEAAGKILSERS
ncbi:phosphoribosylglycinamide formyltransferase [Acaromyces ingoldii]|uniref:phosphoribosylglycinamide formyltransferase 1 n=1 Tax=Acaromyces ingoldii TaxID=215250 RepID=A0A316YM94_9BASI|nr:phosphoribosylglycinamide formyltransferase [Acaromyces ingoldii]PWN90186.1 phosphoribosylglycinamide formyltransferase [Acaromyces ingoldii]